MFFDTFLWFFQRKNLGAYVVSHCISNQNHLFFFKKQNNAGKKQNKFEIFEKTAGNATSNGGGLECLRSSMNWFDVQLSMGTRGWSPKFATGLKNMTKCQLLFNSDNLTRLKQMMCIHFTSRRLSYPFSFVISTFLLQYLDDCPFAFFYKSWKKVIKKFYIFGHSF